MQKDIVDLDTQNHLTNPIDGLDPYPLSNNDKLPKTSDLEVPNQEPVVTDTETPLAAIGNAVSTELARQIPEPTEEPEKPAPITVPQPQPEEETYVREETPEEQYQRMVEGWSEKNPEYNYYIEETGRVVRTNQKDYKKAKFDYLSFKMRQDYVNRTHNYQDYGADVYKVGTGAVSTLAKSVANQTIDFLTGSASFISSTTAKIAAGALDVLSYKNREEASKILKFDLFRNNSLYKDYNPGQMSSLINDAEIEKMKASGADREEIAEYVKSKYPVPEKYKISPTLFKKSEEFDELMRKLPDEMKRNMASAQESYMFYKNLNKAIKEKLGTEITESDNPTVAYWGSVVSSTVLCAAGMFAGGMGWLMPAGYAAMEWDQSIEEGMANGKTFNESLARSYAVAAVSLITEKLQLSSALKRFPTLKEFMWKGMAMWTAENVGQEIAQDLSIMATKHTLGLAEYSVQEYLATIPETGLAALVASVPMAAVASHRKTKLAKDLMAAGMKEENAIKFADIITEKGLDALKENPMIMKDYIDSFNDVFKTTKVIIARNALEAGKQEAQNNEKAIQTAHSEADRASGSGNEGYVYKTQNRAVFADPLTGYHATGEDFEQFDESKRGSTGKVLEFGDGAYFLLDKNKDIKAYSGRIFSKVGRAGDAYVLTVQLPDSNTFFDFTKSLAKQPTKVKEQFSKVISKMKEKGYIANGADSFMEENGKKLFDIFTEAIGIKDNAKKIDAVKTLSKMMREEGIKGNIYENGDQGTGVVLFNEEEDAKIIYKEKLENNKQAIASKVKSFSEEKLNAMTLEEFLKETNIEKWFDPKYKEQILNPEKAIDAIMPMLTNTGLFSPDEAAIAARHFVMASYVQMAMFGSNQTPDFIRIFPSIVNAYMYSAFGQNGEYAEILSRLPAGNILRYSPAVFTEQVASNQALLKELFGDKQPSVEELKGIATLTKMILDGKEYQGTQSKNPELQKASRETERQFQILKTALSQELNDGSGTTVLDNLRALFSFEARLQRRTSYAPSGELFESYNYKNSKYGILDNTALEEHYMDLAILRVFGLWGADANYRQSIEGDEKSFWNKNRNNPDLYKRFERLDTHQVATDVRAVNSLLARNQKDLNTKNEFKRITSKDQAAALIDDILFKQNARGLIDSDGNVDIFAVSTRGLANTGIHEFGHEIFMMVVDTLQQYKQYNPQKAKRIYNALAKLYESKYREKLAGEMTPLQTKRLHEMFASLYTKSLVEGLEATEATKDVNDLLTAVAKTNKILRNPATPLAFVKEDGSVVYDDNYDKELWENVWNELNRKEDYETLLNARNMIMEGIQSGQNETRLFYDVQSEILKMPNSNIKAMLLTKMKSMNFKMNALDGQILNNILVKAAVNNMFGVQMVNQNLVDMAEDDPTVSAARTLGKAMAVSKAAYRKYMPDSIKTFLNKAYITGAKTWESIEKDVAKAVNEDGFAKSALNFFRKMLQPLSTTAKKLGGKVHYKLAWAVFMENQHRAALNITYDKVYNARNMLDESLQAKFDDALLDQDWETAEKLMDAAGQPKEIIRELASDLESVYSLYEIMDPYGDGTGKIDRYFPRHLKDMDGMINYMMQIPKYKKIAEELMANREINEKISSYVLSHYGEGYNPELKRPGNTKKRLFSKIPDDLKQFYSSPLEALRIYYDDAMNCYGRYLIFGTNAANKIEKDFTTDTIAVYDKDTKQMKDITFRVFLPTKNWSKTLKELGFWKEGDSAEAKEYNKKLVEVMEGTLYRGKPHPGITIARTINNITTINNFFTAMSNLVDFAITGYRYGFKNTLMATQKHFANENVVEYNKLLPDLYKEFEMDNYKLNRAYNQVFKWSGFSMLDIFGKQTSIDAAFLSAQEKLLTGDQSIINKISNYMGNDQDLTSATIQDILNNNISDNVKFFLFNELSAQQPLTVLDVPYFYNRHPNLRIFYQFRTFAIRQMDFYVNNVLLPKFQTNPMGALKDSVKFMALLCLFGVPKEAIKALFLGQPFDISDECISQILALGLVNKYSFYEAKKGRYISAATHTIIPSIPVLTRFTADAKGLTIGKKVGKKGRKRIGITDMQSIKNIPSIGPVGGEWLYWWFGGGDESHFTVSV